MTGLCVGIAKQFKTEFFYRNWSSICPNHISEVLGYEKQLMGHTPKSVFFPDLTKAKI